MRAGLPFDIVSLHEFYGQGGTAADMIEMVFARIGEVDDPGIFIHLADKRDLLAQATVLGAFDPAAKPLWGILSRSKTISTSQACRRPPHARTMPMWHKRMRPLSVFCERPGR